MQDSHSFQLDHRVLQSLSSLSYREGDLKAYLNEIACGVSKLMDLDWSVVTLDLGEFDRILASSVDIGEAADQLYPMHGTVTKTVVSTGEPLTVRDTKEDAQHGQTPEGYRAYLGVPLRSPTGKVLGTICSFHGTPRSFTEEEVRYAELFAERAATALDNYHLYQQQISFNERLEQEVVSRTEELRETQAKLIEKERLAAIGEFTSMIVHEIRNPLTTIEMGLNALGRLDLSENNRLRLSLALEEEVRLKALLNQILQYAKPQVLETSVFDLNHLIRETTGSLSDQPNIQDRNVELVVESSALNINGDRNKLKQVLINLITNACEAVNPSDTVSIQVSQSLSESQENSCLIQVRVHNGGDPIPPDVLPKLTQPFFSTKSSGNGLGLAIVKRIVDAHRGQLSLNSSAESGTLITINLPQGI